MRSGPSPTRSRTRGHRTATGPMPVMISRLGRCPCRTSRWWPSSVSLSAWSLSKAATSASTACASSARAPLRKTSVSGSAKLPGWESWKTLVSVTAYHSFGGEVEASNTPTIRRLTPSCRHQLSPIAWAQLPMVVLATAATVIASQAVITGAYSLTQQAIHLGLLPRLEIRHTSEALFGQIYMPSVNTLLLIGVLMLVGLFRSSSALASAYGIAVTGTMVVTAMMAFVVIWKVWRWSAVAAVALIAPLLALDLTFLSANLLKVFEGGWMPLALGGIVMMLMYTWRRGSRLLVERSRKLEFPLADLVTMLEKRPPQRVSGTAVFLTSDPASAPTALMHSLKHYKVLHEKNVILTIETAPTPRIDPAERVRLEQISATFSKITLRFGFMESPNVPKALAIARKLGWQFDIMSTSFFLSRRALKPAAHSGMPRWQDHLFIALSRAANDATDYFQIPTGRVVEVGTQVTV